MYTEFAAHATSQHGIYICYSKLYSVWYQYCINVSINELPFPSLFLLVLVMPFCFPLRCLSITSVMWRNHFKEQTKWHDHASDRFPWIMDQIHSLCKVSWPVNCTWMLNCHTGAWNNKPWHAVILLHTERPAYIELKMTTPWGSWIFCRRSYKILHLQIANNSSQSGLPWQRGISATHYLNCLSVEVNN